MNDRYDGYAGGDRYELVGYDEFGQPVYRQVPQQPAGGYDGYGAGQQGYGYDPYAAGAQESGGAYASGGQQPAPPYDTGQHPAVPPPYDTGQHPAASPYDTGRQPAQGYDGYGARQHGYGTGAPDGGPGYDAYGRHTEGTGRQPRVAEQTAYIPQQAGPPTDDDDRADRDYRTEQFAFVEEPEAESEDVIDWLKFTENRTERREEAKRRARGRVVALVVVLALVLVGGAGYLWYAGRLPGTSSDGGPGTTTAAAAQKRDVIVVHLHNTKGGGTSTALLVDNTTTRQGTTVLLPNSLALTDDDGSTTTLAKSVDADGSSGTRDAVDTVLGTDIQGTWRLDTPYLDNLVELVGNIDITTNTAVPDPEAKKKGTAPLVKKGADQTLSGRMAVAYATYRASGRGAERAAGTVRPGHAGRAAQAVLGQAGRDDHRADPGPDPRPLPDRPGPRRLPRQARRPRQGRRLQDRAAARAAGRHARARTPPTAWSRTSSAARPRAPRRAPRSGSASRTPPATRRPPGRPGSPWSTAATPTWTPAPRARPRGRVADHLRRRGQEGRRRRGRQDAGPADLLGAARARSPPTPTCPWSSARTTGSDTGSKG